ncbi:MAG: hypothetical protein OEZ01_06670 [Candidatus Heimdallarchaeota archaeon]|nr:hypothetical protein [Candidatus Heimdallarchaeota archaeon]MDH5645672.1 hypothetical protein [Candidatus Heimdallarchaeota archaeon]
MVESIHLVTQQGRCFYTKNFISDIDNCEKLIDNQLAKIIPSLRSMLDESFSEQLNKIRVESHEIYLYYYGSFFVSVVNGPTDNPQISSKIAENIINKINPSLLKYSSKSIDPIMATQIKNRIDSILYNFEIK